MSLDHYIKMNTTRSRENLMMRLREIAQSTSNQFALYLYLHHKGRASLYQLYRTYNEIIGRRVRLSTVRKQLKVLEERYKAIRREGNYYTALLPPEELLQAINPKRARAGRKGALKRIKEDQSS